MLEVTDTALPEVKLIRPRRFEDPRGSFSETWSRAAWAAAGIDLDFVQDNQSLSRAAGTVRGLHLQRPPQAQAKLVRVLQGAIFDVVVDIRPESPRFRRFCAVELSAAGGTQLFVPAEGFAHGFCTLVPDSVVFYKVSAPYAPRQERGILWNDPALAIPWPVAADAAVLSDKDRAAPTLDALLRQEAACG
jgi:dTDP-4-dehydrorhamnose 3,5-epimerase